MIQTESSLLIALSGGADSVCLLCVLKELKEELGITLAAMHVHHGIRGEEADEDANFCRQLCQRLQVPCHVVQVDVPAVAAEQRLSLEEAARLVRYGELERYRQQLGADHIAVAHHREDQAETVLWNLFRGSGLRGLGGMEPVNGTVIRPLLHVSRQEILGYLQEQEILWQQDSTNRGDEYTRNRIRHHILGYATAHLNERAAEHICQAAEWAGQADRYLRKQAQDWLKAEADETGEEAAAMTADRKPGVSLSIPRLLREEEILQNYILREALRRCGGLVDVTARHVELLRHLLTEKTGGSAYRYVELGGGMLASRSYDILRILTEEKREIETVRRSVDPASTEVEIDLRRLMGGADPERTGESPVKRESMEVVFGENRFSLRIISCEKSQKIPTNQYTKWINYDKLERTLVFRTRRVGDYILLPDGGRKTVKSYMIDEKIPAGERDRIPVIAQGSHVLWIAGYRLSQGAKVTENTQYILEIKQHGG
ncbi:MAG: tRNA lysidine(34) synthetase TilS [Lachnospiraceae bacterium]|nr:tRNA lysidine(34) synthetase TilS [Lachnospiraceae bacterium]